ncbi:hypothetical protein KFK09_003085 [Dendrobium nobile]|uniref:Uncharacterized protein n=1 Tax=Dendrobium nobile TaxID=94219 RepID=A0A8T3C3H7_DENNO|nr:hypothetical protein KFK09_003085 [Dendrobium nobile]
MSDSKWRNAFTLMKVMNANVLHRKNYSVWSPGPNKNVRHLIPSGTAARYRSVPKRKPDGSPVWCPHRIISPYTGGSCLMVMISIYAGVITSAPAQAAMFEACRKGFNRPQSSRNDLRGEAHHDVPAARNSSHNTSSSAAATASRSNYSSHDILPSNQNGQGRSDQRNNVYRPVAVLQLKGEHEMT